MTPEERRDLRRKAEAATPGPWRVHVDGADDYDDFDVECEVVQSLGYRPFLYTPVLGQNDAGKTHIYIAAASPDVVVRLLDRVNELEAENSRLRTAITFDELRAANVERCKLWHPGFPADDSWTLADWSNAMCGEAGEAANVVKKLRRVETGLHATKTATVDDLADELADVLCYLDLLAAKVGIDLAAAAVKKFNEVSEREGFDVKLRAALDKDNA